jgi:nucleotide sugar dehydrogenase
MTIFSEELETGLKRIREKDLKICVAGVGTVGLPLATFLAVEGFEVRGLDVNEERVSQINSGTVPFEYPELLNQAISQKKLIATTDAKTAVTGADVIFCCVPTPLDKNKACDISNLIDVAKRISIFIKSGVLLIVESSVSIGSTKKFGLTIESNTDFKIGTNFGLAYCPERYNPSLPLEKILPKVVYTKETILPKRHTLDEISRVVGGYDKKSMTLTKSIYSQIIRTSIQELSSIEAAEATKLLENIFRDVNIALVNQLAQIYSKLGLNIYEIIDAAKTKPFAFMPHYPGIGVGGECIPVDTWYLIKQAEELNLDTSMLTTAREINDSMPNYTLKFLESKLHEFNLSFDKSKITILGLAYKRNIHDTRLSPTFTIMEILKQKNAEYVVCDPIVQFHNNLHDLTSIDRAFENSDAILLVTDHDIFKDLDLALIKNQMRTPIIVDGRNFFSKKQVTDIGFSYISI